MARPLDPYYPVDHGRMGRCIYDVDRWWSRILYSRRAHRKFTHFHMHGHMQLVADRAAEVQERDPRPLGPRKACHQMSLGLNVSVFGSVTFSLRL
jgi:hypothetical protein